MCEHKSDSFEMRVINSQKQVISTHSPIRGQRTELCMHRLILIDDETTVNCYLLSRVFDLKFYYLV